MIGTTPCFVRWSEIRIVVVVEEQLRDHGRALIVLCFNLCQSTYFPSCGDVPFRKPATPMEKPLALRMNPTIDAVFKPPSVF
jgi:hypothetical protein